MLVYQIQAEGTLDQVVKTQVEGKADVQDLLMEYCKMKPPPSIEGGGLSFLAKLQSELVQL